MTKTLAKIQAILAKQGAIDCYRHALIHDSVAVVLDRAYADLERAWGKAEAQRLADRPFFSIKGIDRMLDETYVSDKTYHTKEAAQAHCRASEWVEEWRFNRVEARMDNSTHTIHRNVKTGEEKKSPGRYAHGDRC